MTDQVTRLGAAEAMLRALDLARGALGRTAPNPAVGAVVLHDGWVVGEGATQPAGGPHAEIEALAAAGPRARGATLVVTLEPCCHHGRTPPCTDAIVAAGIARVVAGTVDPFPSVRGGGFAALRAAGIEVVSGVEEEACRRVSRGFARAVTDGLPEVTLKVAMSLDGRIATEPGESRWITGREARADGHRLRAEHDAVLIGISTALADDPELTVRWDGAPRTPVPVVLDSDLRLPTTAKLLATGRAVVVAADDAPGDLPATVLRVPRTGRHLDVTAAFRALAAYGLHRILVEGGGTVHRAVLDAGLADTVVAYVAGLLLPGGRPWVGGPPVARLGEAHRLVLVDVARIGADVRLTYEVPRPR
jgi:diaminohydroxyphosphoribosylaminopyrimidine deaminase/5-amino-6-(5-phosphoribosylamino)uracil reductase